MKPENEFISQNAIDETKAVSEMQNREPTVTITRMLECECGGPMFKTVFDCKPRIELGCRDCGKILYVWPKEVSFIVEAV